MSSPPYPRSNSRSAWGNETDKGGTLEVDDVDDEHPRKPKRPGDGEQELNDGDKKSKEVEEADEEEDDTEPGCCSRCCAGCCRGIGFVLMLFIYLILYIIGFAFLIALGALHLTFRIVHAIFNLFAQLRRANIDMVREFDYGNESDASGSELEQELEDAAALDAYEKQQVELQQQQSLGVGGGGNAAGPNTAARQRSVAASGGKYQTQPGAQGHEGAGGEVPLAKPKRTRQDLEKAREYRRKLREDDKRRVRAVLEGKEDPGAADGTNRIYKPPNFASCGCAAQVFIAFIGTVMVSITFLFYALAQITLLGFVALLSAMIRKSTVGGMMLVKEFQERNDIVVKRPWVQPPPPQEDDENGPKKV
jgi:hypothetical protein